MDWIQFFLIVQIVIVILLIGSVLLQPSSTDGLSGIGGGGMGSSGGTGLLSGRAKVTALSTATKWLAVTFISNSLFLSNLSGTGEQQSNIEQKLLEGQNAVEETIVPIEE